MITSKLLKPVPSGRKAKDESLFSGIWLRWSALNTAERLVCTIIVLMPVWWALGLIPYLIDFTVIGVALYDWQRYGKLRLKRPSLLVIVLLAYYTYEFSGSFLLFFNAHPLAVLPPGDAKRPFDLLQGAFSAFALPYLVWYIQSNNIRVRLEVVAWACTVSVIQQLGVWLVAHFLFGSSPYNPPRTLLGLLTGKSSAFARGSGNTNYLLLYSPTDRGIGGLPRFYSFFHAPESFALFAGVVGTLALSIKNRLWSLLLLIASVFLIGVSGTRAVWVAFPLVLVAYFLFATGKGGVSRIFALIAVVSFVTLLIPPVTDLIFDTFNNTATLVANFREGSTEERGAAYAETLERILDNLVNFLFGYQVSGPNATGTNTAIGSHSFLLGSLLYKGGLVATGLFMTFWGLLIAWLYRTRFGRPACCFLIILLLSLTFATMLLAHVAPMAILLSMMLRKPAMKSLSLGRNTFA